MSYQAMTPDPQTVQHWLELIQAGQQQGAVQLPEGQSPRLAPLGGIRAVVFDVYGTLFSSGVGDISLATQDNRDSALRATLSAHQVELSQAADSVRLDQILHHRIATHQARRREAGIEYPEVEIRAVWQDFLDTLTAEGLSRAAFDGNISTLVIDYERRVNPTQPMPQLAAVLQTIRASGQVMSIISNAQFYTPLLFQSYLNRDLASLGFCNACNVWSYRELEGKPSTQLYLKAAAQLQTHHGIAPHEVLYVGNDLRNDIWPAQKIGFRTALFAGDRLSLRRREDDPNCRNVTADIELTELSQLLNCIGIDA
ncbi:MAG: putative hydrolase of the HAD superfamily [Lentimonas sp.]|jgi:putative hydrolase of the HAD superfamily